MLLKKQSLKSMRKWISAAVREKKRILREMIKLIVDEINWVLLFLFERKSHWHTFLFRLLQALLVVMWSSSFVIEKNAIVHWSRTTFLLLSSRFVFRCWFQCLAEYFSPILYDFLSTKEMQRRRHLIFKFIGFLDALCDVFLFLQELSFCLWSSMAFKEGCRMRIQKLAKALRNRA